MKPRMLPRDEIHKLLQALPSACRLEIAAHIAAAHIRIAKLEAVAEAAKLLKRSGPCDGPGFRRTCECGPCQLDRALENLEGER